MYTYTLNGTTLHDDQIFTVCNFTEHHFGVARLGTVVHKSKWINAYEAVYTIDSEHATEAQAQLRVDEIIARGMVGLSKAELECVAASRSIDKWRESEAQL